MADVNSSNALSKSRSILGEITNLPSKREIPEIEKCGIKRSKSMEKESAKKTRVTPTPCAEIDMLKGNLLKLSNEDRDVKVLGFGCNAVSKSSIDGETEFKDVHSLIGENAVGSSKVCNGNRVVESLDSGRRTSVLQSVNELNIGNDLVDLCGEIGISEGNALDMDSIDLERGKAADSVATKIDGLKKLDLMMGSNVPIGAEVSFETINHGVSNGRTDPSSTEPPSEGTIGVVNVEACNKLGHSFLADSSRTVSETGGDTLSGSEDLDAGESKVTHRDINAYQNDGDEQNADNFVMSQSGSIDCMILPESQESRVFGVDRSTEPMKGDECGYIHEGIDSIKACSCSFCTKAAYIWLDLNYQDIKARVSVMKKSQKEASTLAERSTRHKGSESHVAESFTGVSNLVYNLMHQWRSLFHHMGDVLDEESNQLEARLLPLTDLREKYKVDLETINGALTEKH